MMANNYYYGNGFTSAAPQKVVMNQMLSKEEIAKLKSKNKSWSLQLTEDEVLTEMCSHKDPDTGDISIVDNHDGTVTCSICGETFSLVNDLSEEEVQNICDDFNDVWQTSKTNYGSMPIQAGRAFYKMGALAKKVPQFYKLGQESRKQWNHSTMVEANRGASAFAQLSMLLNPMAGGYGAAPMGYPGMAPVAPGMAPGAAAHRLQKVPLHGGPHRGGNRHGPLSEGRRGGRDRAADRRGPGVTLLCHEPVFGVESGPRRAPERNGLSRREKAECR